MKQKILLFGWITLLLFPLPAFLFRFYTDQVSLSEFLQVQNIQIVSIGLGLQFGVVYAFIAYLFMQAPFFDKVPTKIDRIIGELNLKVYQGIFLSLCAGIGEELLFRAGVQHYLGWWITAILFVALHGYLNPFNLRFSVYGLIVLPFILLISLAYFKFGLWFCIAAHFSYDAVLFTFMIKETKSK